MDMTTRSQQAVSEAVKNAAERGNPAVEPAHLAVALLDDGEGLTRPLLQAVGVDPLALRAEAQRLVDRLPSASGSTVGSPATSRALLAVLGAAEREARDRSDEYVSTEHLLLALAGTPNDVADALKQHGATPAALADALQSVRGTRGSPARTPRAPSRRWRSTATTSPPRRARARSTRSSAATRRSAG